MDVEERGEGGSWVKDGRTLSGGGASDEERDVQRGWGEAPEELE